MAVIRAVRGCPILAHRRTCTTNPASSAARTAWPTGCRPCRAAGHVGRQPLEAAIPGSGAPARHRAGGSVAVAGVDGADAGTEVAVAAADQAGLLHHRLEFFLRRMLADGLGQVA